MQPKSQASLIRYLQAGLFYRAPAASSFPGNL